jgi:hypothetical protein
MPPGICRQNSPAQVGIIDLMAIETALYPAIVDEQQVEQFFAARDKRCFEQSTRCVGGSEEETSGNRTFRVQIGDLVTLPSLLTHHRSD